MADHLEQMAEESTDRIPTALLEQPEIDEHLAHAWEAFKLLSATRDISVGMDGVIVQRIKATEAAAMADAIGWPVLDFLRVITPADALYVETTNSRRAT